MKSNLTSSSEFSITTVPTIVTNITEHLETTVMSLLNTTSTEEPPVDFRYDDISTWTNEVYIQIYTLFIVAAVLLTSARSILFFKICMTASTNLHNMIFKNVLQATMRFFDTNPSGKFIWH